MLFGLFSGNDHFKVTNTGTLFDVPNDNVELISDENGTEIYGYNKGESFYYVIAFNYIEKS